MQNRAITVRLPEDLAEQLRREAFERRTSQASIVLEALRAQFGPSGASGTHVTVPVTVPGAQSPEYLRTLQDAVQEAVLRYGEIQKKPGKPSSAPGPLLTVEEVAAELHIARRRVFEMIANGTLPSLKIGKSRRIKRADLEAYINGLS